VTKYTRTELLTVSASRLLEDGKIVFAGVGIPLLASILAQKIHAPSLTIVVEGGAIAPEVAPRWVPLSTNEMRVARRALMLPSITDLFLYAQRGFFDYGFLGAAQIDPYGNINTTVIGSLERPRVRLPGSGGANDIASHCREVIVVLPHEPRRFVKRVDFITSPGYLSGGDSRRRAGLLFGGVRWVLTDLALFRADPETGKLRLKALQAGVRLEDVEGCTGFPVEVDLPLEEILPPTEEELRVLRELDWNRIFIGEAS